MREAGDKLKLWKRFFGRLFLFSFVALFISLLVVPQLGSPSASDTPPLILIASLITSITSLIGIFLTTIVAWRKERREAKSFELDNRKKELEIERLKGELGKMGVVNERATIKDRRAAKITRDKKQRKND
jgi:predicted histidine transporter YuiF (NhaC family)